MEENLYVLLEETIIRELKKAATLEEGGEKDNIYKNVVALYKVHNETEKNAFESSDRYSDREQNNNQHESEMEMEAKKLEIEEKKMKEERFNLFVNGAIAVGSTLLGIITYDIWMRRGLRFEEHGTIVNPWTKNLMSKMLPKK